MRLHEKELKAIRTYFSSHFSDGELFLFGSRADDKKKVGEIDLLFIVSESIWTEIGARKNKIVFDLQGYLGEQRIDLLIVNSKLIDIDPFLIHIMQNSPIKIWPEG